MLELRLISHSGKWLAMAALELSWCVDGPVGFLSYFLDVLSCVWASKHAIRVSRPRGKKHLTVVLIALELFKSLIFFKLLSNVRCISALLMLLVRLLDCRLHAGLLTWGASSSYGLSIQKFLLCKLISLWLINNLIGLLFDSFSFLRGDLHLDFADIPSKNINNFWVLSHIDRSSSFKIFDVKLRIVP